MAKTIASRNVKRGAYKHPKIMVNKSSGIIRFNQVCVKNMRFDITPRSVSFAVLGKDIVVQFFNQAVGQGQGAIQRVPNNGSLQVISKVIANELGTKLGIPKNQERFYIMIDIASMEQLALQLHFPFNQE